MRRSPLPWRNWDGRPVLSCWPQQASSHGTLPSFLHRCTAGMERNICGTATWQSPFMVCLALLLPTATPLSRTCPPLVTHVSHPFEALTLSRAPTPLPRTQPCRMSRTYLCLTHTARSRTISSMSSTHTPVTCTRMYTWLDRCNHSPSSASLRSS